MKKIFAILGLFSISSEAMRPGGNGKQPYGGYGTPYSTRPFYGTSYQPGSIRPNAFRPSTAKKVTPPKKNQEARDLKEAMKASLKPSQPFSLEDRYTQLLNEQESIKKDLKATEEKLNLLAAQHVAQEAENKKRLDRINELKTLEFLKREEITLAKPVDKIKRRKELSDIQEKIRELENQKPKDFSVELKKLEIKHKELMEKEENTTRAITALTKKIGEEEKEKIEEPKPQEIKIEKKEEKPALSAEQVKKKGDLEKKINELKEKIKKSEKLPVLLQMYREDLGKKELELQRLEAQGNSPVKPVVIKEAEKLLPVMQRSRTPEMPKKEEPKRLKTPDVKKSVLREKEERNEEEEERAPQSYNELPLREGYASGEGNNCSLHAVIGQSEHLAIAIMGKAEGKKIFAAHQKNREYSLNTVRGKVCDDLLAFLKGNRLYNVNGENRSVQDLLQDPAGGSHKVQAYLTKIKTSGEQLPPEFIVAMSYHYRISIEVLRMVEQPRWGYKANAIPEVLHHVLKNPIFVRDVAHIRNYFGTLENFLRSDEHAGTKIDGLDQCIDKNPEYVESLSQLIATIQKEQKKTKGYVNAFPNSYHQEGEAPLLVLHRGGSGQNANRVFGGHYTPLLIK